MLPLQRRGQPRPAKISTAGTPVSQTQRETEEEKLAKVNEFNARMGGNFKCNVCGKVHQNKDNQEVWQRCIVNGIIDKDRKYRDGILVETGITALPNAKIYFQNNGVRYTPAFNIIYEPLMDNNDKEFHPIHLFTSQRIDEKLDFKAMKPYLAKNDFLQSVKNYITERFFKPELINLKNTIDDIVKNSKKISDYIKTEFGVSQIKFNTGDKIFNLDNARYFQDYFPLCKTYSNIYLDIIQYNGDVYLISQDNIAIIARLDFKAFYKPEIIYFDTSVKRKEIGNAETQDSADEKHINKLQDDLIADITENIIKKITNWQKIKDFDWSYK